MRLRYVRGNGFVMLLGSLTVAVAGCGSGSSQPATATGDSGSSDVQTSGEGGSDAGPSDSALVDSPSTLLSDASVSLDAATSADSMAPADSAVSPTDSSVLAMDSTVPMDAAGGMDSTMAPDTSTQAEAGTPSDTGACVGAICTATTFAEVAVAHPIPTWVKNTKLGIGMHFMVAAVPADHNEWFYQHEYCNSSFATWTSTYFPKTSPMSDGGPWGYKDFIPLFTVSRWSQTAAAGAATTAASWAALFKASGATYVNVTAMHHDRFAMWDSAEPASMGGAGTWNAAKMGPMRDVVGELGAAVKAQGLKYGANNHMMYGYSFAYCGPNGTTPGNVGPNTPATVSDLYDPRYASLYGPPNPGCGVEAADGTCASVSAAFCNDWLYRANELVDKYELDDEWFDWDGASQCQAQKLAFVLHYYQTAAGRGQDVQIMGKGGVFPATTGTTASNVCLPDSQAADPSPVPTTPWMEDVPVSSTGSWCYVDANGGAPNSVPMAYISGAEAVDDLERINGKGGIMMLNISPMADGTIPQGQIDILNALGKHLGAQ